MMFTKKKVDSRGRCVFGSDDFQQPLAVDLGKLKDLRRATNQEQHNICVFFQKTRKKGGKPLLFLVVFLFLFASVICGCLFPIPAASNFPGFLEASQLRNH